MFLTWWIAYAMWGWRETVIDPLLEDREAELITTPVPPEQPRALVA